MDNVIEVVIRPDSNTASSPAAIPYDSVGSEQIKDDSITVKDINREEFASDDDIEQLFATH